MKKSICCLILLFCGIIAESDAATFAPPLPPGVYRCMYGDRQEFRLSFTSGVENFIVLETSMPHVSAIEYRVRLLNDSGKTFMVLQPLRKSGSVEWDVLPMNIQYADLADGVELHFERKKLLLKRLSWQELAFDEEFQDDLLPEVIYCSTEKSGRVYIRLKKMVQGDVEICKLDNQGVGFNLLRQTDWEFRLRNARDAFLPDTEYTMRRVALTSADGWSAGLELDMSYTPVTVSGCRLVEGETGIRRLWYIRPRLSYSGGEAEEKMTLIEYLGYLANSESDYFYVYHLTCSEHTAGIFLYEGAVREQLCAPDGRVVATLEKDAQGTVCAIRLAGGRRALMRRE